MRKGNVSKSRTTHLTFRAVFTQTEDSWEYCVFGETPGQLQSMDKLLNRSPLPPRKGAAPKHWADYDQFPVPKKGLLGSIAALGSEVGMEFGQCTLYYGCHAEDSGGGEAWEGRRTRSIVKAKVLTSSLSTFSEHIHRYCLARSRTQHIVCLYMCVTVCVLEYCQGSKRSTPLKISKK